MEVATRDRLRARYDYRCGYCGVNEISVGATLTQDHHKPKAHGGSDQDDNLVYCCPRCNDHKGDYWHEVHRPGIRLLHPLKDDLTNHLVEDWDGQVIGKTAEGLFFVERLRLNRPELVRHRVHRNVIKAKEAGHQALLCRVKNLQDYIALLGRSIAEVEAEIERESE